MGRREGREGGGGGGGRRGRGEGERRGGEERGREEGERRGEDHMYVCMYGEMLQRRIFQHNVQRRHYCSNYVETKLYHRGVGITNLWVQNYGAEFTAFLIAKSIMENDNATKAFNKGAPEF